MTVTGLTNGTTYTLTVTATNAAFTGPPSVASNPVTPTATTSGGGGTTTSGGHCDWTVTFDKAPMTALVEANVPYRVTVANAGKDGAVPGSAACPATTLFVQTAQATEAGRETSLTATSTNQYSRSCQSGGQVHDYCLAFDVPDLGAGGSVTFTFSAEQSLGLLAIFPIGGADTGLVTITATIDGGDFDDPPVDQTAFTTTERILAGITTGNVTVNGNGTGKVPFTCPAPTGCNASGVITAQPSRAADRAAPARKARLKRLGTASGTVPGGKRGVITFHMNGTGLQLLRAGRRLRAQLVLTVRDRTGQISTLTYRITLRLRP
jgi:hypothetical protein